MPAPGDTGNGRDTALPLAGVLERLRELEQALTAGLAVALSEERANVDQWRVLEAIARLAGPTMGEIAVATGMPNASLSRIIDGLEDAAHCYRVPDSDDRRRITVLLTDRGQSLLARVRTIVRDWERATESRLGADATEALRDGIDAGVAAMGLRVSQLRASY